MKTIPTLVAAIFCAVLGARASSQQSMPREEDPLQRILDGGEPRDVDELRAMQAHVQALLEEVLPATVSLGGATGVLVEGGFVLTAGHVTRRSGRKMKITLHDGRVLDGVSLGANLAADSGLIRVVTEGEFPTRPMGRSNDLQVGQWCLMLGHPSGAKAGRSAPARLGRVLRVPAQGYLVTDCLMQGGDSGGPLFDMDGRVIGINSRISANLAQNMHVPIDAFGDEWDKLVAGEVVQAPQRGGSRPSFGLRLERGEGVRVREVVPDSPAAAAGLEPGDAIIEVNGKAIADRMAYARALRGRESDEVEFEVLRGEQVLTLKAKMPRSGR